MIEPGLRNGNPTMSKPFAFGFDGDDIDTQGAEGLQDTEPAVTHACSPGVVRPQLLSVKDLVRKLEFWFLVLYPPVYDPGDFILLPLCLTTSFLGFLSPCNKPRHE